MKSIGRMPNRGLATLSLVPGALTGPVRARTIVPAPAPARAPAREHTAGMPAAEDAASSSGPIRRVVIEEDGDLAFVAVSEVQCIESRGDLVVLHTARRSHLMRATLQALHARLGETFLRIHRSILVNVEAIARMQRTPRGDFVLTLANGQRYASSASHRHALLDYIRRCRP